MKLQRTTLILLLLALGLGGFVYFYEIQGATQRQEAKEQKQQIFSFEQEQVQSFAVKTKQQTLNFERDEPGISWRMKTPSDTPASDASVSYLMNLLVKGKSDRTIQATSAQLQEYGLTQPQATIEVKLKNSQTHQLLLGKPSFSGNFLYAQADPPAKPSGNVDVLLVSPDFENAVNRQLSEWKINEPKPEALDKGSPSPSP